MTSVFNRPNSNPSSCFGFCHDGSGISNGMRKYHQQQHDDHQLTFEDLKKKKEMDDMLAQAMSGLSFEERQKQQEILHGVDGGIAENEDALSSALEELESHLRSSKQGSAYEMAEMMDPEYVQLRAFRVMFLRCDDYDAKVTAEHILRFFELKKNLFGREKLVKDITMEDLTENDIACLKSGYVQSLGRDRSGRQVSFYVGSQVGDMNSPEAVHSYMRAKYYVTMKALDSEETQLRGSVSVWYITGDLKNKSNGNGYFEIFTVARDLPKKRQALHICVDDTYQYLLLNGLLKLMPGKMRARLRVHYGSVMECKYQLSTYGIPSELIPVDHNGRLKLDRHLQWVQSCTLDTSCDNVNSSAQFDCSQPGPNDVLFTGAKVSYSEGNQRFLALVHDFAQIYDSGNLESKKAVVDQIIHKIHGSGGRFLRRQEGSDTLWEEVPVAVLRKKVTQSFRNFRRQRQVKKPKKTSEIVPTDS